MNIDGIRVFVVGICQLTGQYILYDNERKMIRMARTVKLVPEIAKWDAGSIESLKPTPFSEHIAQDQGVVFQERDAKPGDADLPAKSQLSRRLYILQRDLANFGFSVGCPKCDHERRYGPGQTTKSHSNACRERIRGELMKTPEGQRRIQAVDDRTGRSIAEQGEHAQVPPVHGGMIL